MKNVWAVAALAACMIAGPALSATDLQVGRWKLNLAKSRYATAGPPRSAEGTVTPFGDGVTVDIHRIDAEGHPASTAYSARYDGKPYPRTETGPGATNGVTLTLRRIDAHTVERIVYLGKQSGGTERWVISPDGKTRSVFQSGVDFKGKPIDNVQVYDRQ